MIEKRSATRGLQRFAYDPLGRRIEKTEHGSDGYPLGETRFTWDGLRLLQEHKHSQTSLYVYEDEGYQPLARVDGNGALQKIRYYHNDLNGLPEQLTEADGHNVWQATYRVWGNTLEEVREPYYIEEQNLRFQGQYLDRETGLHFNTFRFYDPDVGRFTTPDPISLAGGLNAYVYTSDPYNYIDPLGLKCSHFAKNPKQAHAQIKSKWGHTMSKQEMKELQNTINRIKLRQPHYSNDGTPFQNSRSKGNPYSQRLNTGSGPYQEWTVTTPNVGNNGARRIVVDKKTGQAYYSHDHYDSFIEINLGGWK